MMFLPRSKKIADFDAMWLRLDIKPQTSRMDKDGQTDKNPISVSRFSTRARDKIN